MDIELNYSPVLPGNLGIPIGCIGAGFIMNDCHLVAYRRRRPSGIVSPKFMKPPGP